ncbi:MAG: hypothetical protein QW165_03680 [Candidatus Woesearchaeota archaeon]
MKKGAVDYSWIMFFIVIIVLPVLYFRMTTQVETTKQAIGEDQAILLASTYAKEDIINYLEKAAQLELPTILKEAPLNSSPEKFNEAFNKHLNPYIKAFNVRSFTKIPENNYEVYIEGKNIHAISILPIKKNIAKPPTELTSLGTMWFAPSFTITTT